MCLCRLLICCALFSNVLGFTNPRRLGVSLPFSAQQLPVDGMVGFAGTDSRQGRIKILNAAKKAESSKSSKSKTSKPKPVENVDVKVETLKKGDLVKIVAAQTGLTQKSSEEVLTAVINGIQDAVKDGKKVSIPSFGVFSAKVRSARKGRNPQTGEEIQIPESISPGFSPSKSWKDLLNNKV
jgi:DNA-binding protein HU-beta